MSVFRTIHTTLRRALTASAVVAIFGFPLIVAACLTAAEDATPTSTLDGAVATPTIPAIMPTATIQPTPTMPPALEGLLDPGPTAPGPERIIFLNGQDLWTINVHGEATRLTRDMTISAWAQAVSGSLAAFVQTRSIDDTTTQEVRFLTADGSITGAVFGPIVVDGPDAEPEIVEIAWSWGATSLAMLRADGRIEALVGLDDPFRDSSVPVTLVEANSAQSIRDVVWGPTGDGVAYISEQSGSNLLVVAPSGVPPLSIPASMNGPARTVADFVWLPGRGRIAFVEDSVVPGSRAPASIFTTVPDGSALELLVSASSFAPAATIGGLIASPDARELAFVVYSPDTMGQPVFESLWVLHIDSGELREIPIEPGFIATDSWFVAGGLLWRGVDTGADGVDASTTYTGVEPFILAFTNGEGETTVMFQSTLAGKE